MKITCPHCNTQFSLDDTESSAIFAQIRSSEIDKEVEARVRDIENRSKELLDSVKDKAKAENELLIQKAIAEKEKENAELKSKISSMQDKQKISLMEVEMQKEKELLSLKSDMENRLKETQIELDYYKELKSKMSTKMVGETLEQHCLIEFNKIRGMLSPSVYFDKDNEVSQTGSKGDFIFREDADGCEILSIMFEMKNEMDTTEKKHKNEDFLKELDKDRREKGCEYAVLVTMLEADNELYNAGIVDMSYRYPKMYVIRPQFFIPLITILRNAANTSLETKRELARVRNQNLDITHFEENLNKFKEGFAYNYTQASKRFAEAIDEIDKSISHLQKIKDALLASDRQLRLANDKAEDVTIKRLCRGTNMLEKFEGAGGS